MINIYFIKENLFYKKKECEKMSYNWIMILNKDYSEFKNFTYPSGIQGN